MPRRLPAGVLSQQRQRQLQNPYGKSHIAKPRSLPPPVVPTFPQKVTLSDGSTFTHWTTSPRSIIRLTRDISNAPLWTLSSTTGTTDEDTSGRLTRYRSKYDTAGAFEHEDYKIFDEFAQNSPALKKPKE